MAIEKMMFVRATGPVDRLNEFNLKTLTIDFYHPEAAADYLLNTDGWNSCGTSCPFDKYIKQIAEISKHTDFDFSKISSELTDASGIDSRYLQKLMKYIRENDFESSDINTFLSDLKPHMETQSQRLIDLAAKKKQLIQKTDKLKHFASLDIDPNEIVGTKYIDVHFGSLPKDSMIKLYMINNENKLIFNTYSSDDKYFWGAYCVPVQYAQEAARIMSALYFDELSFNSEDGTLNDVTEKCKKELEEIEKAEKEAADFWEENKAKLAEDFQILSDLKTVWQMRKFAVVKDESFCCLGWIPAKMQNEARNIFSGIEEIEFTIKAPEASVTVAGLESTSPLERPIRDIEHLSHHVNYELTPDKLNSVIGTKKALTNEYIGKCTRYLGGAGINSTDSGLGGLNGKIHAVSLLRKELKAREKYLNKKVTRLNRFISLDIDIAELRSISYSVVKFGKLPVQYADTVTSLAEQKGFIFHICSSDDKFCWCIYCVPKKYEQNAAELFSGMYFKEYKMTDTSGTVASIVEKCKKELDTIANEKQNITDFWNKHQDEIVECYSILQDLQHLWNERKNITEKNGKYVYTGTAGASDKKKILTLYSAIGGFGTASEKNTNENSRATLAPPTKLKNLKIFSPFEYYVKMYGMPSYNSIDITSFVAITYTILFGIMFGDLGQGLVLAIGGFLAWRIKKIELGKILVPCGISSCIFGLVFGSVFGYEEALDPLYHAVGMKGKPLHVMDSINTVLLLAIGIGIFLVAMSICINIYASLKEKKYGKALFDNNGLAGLILYLCGVSLVVDFMGSIQIIPSSVLIVLMPVSAIILFLKEILIGMVDNHESAKPESILDFFLQNIFEMIEYVLSYFSNTVSFLRVGAFVLVHAGMMMVVFSLAGESKNIFVVILGNILVIALEGLLTGIQALRLEFYEMFSRCFSGDGKQFISAKDALTKNNDNSI